MERGLAIFMNGHTYSRSNIHEDRPVPVSVGLSQRESLTLTTGQC
jgi:hypothetical protein